MTTIPFLIQEPGVAIEGSVSALRWDILMEYTLESSICEMEIAFCKNHYAGRQGDT